MNKRIKSLILTLASAMGLTFLSGCNFISPNSNNQNNNNNHNSGNVKPTGHTHTFSNYVSDDNATCTEDGTKTAKCDFCDVTNTKQDTRSIKGHSFTHYTSNNDATCTQDGTKTAKCDRCDLTDTQIDTGSKKPHKFVNYVSNNDATCTQDGTKTAKCENCDATNTTSEIGTKKGHSFTNYVFDNNASCTSPGTKTAKCDRCNVTDTKPYEEGSVVHSFTNYVSDNNATCLEDGTKTAKCDNCRAKDTIPDPGTKRGHSFTNYVSDNNGTCICDGTKTAKCDRCDVTDTIPDLDGPKPHSFTNYISNNDATCVKDGTKTAKCDRCDVTDTIVDVGTKRGHSFTNYVSDDNATCLEDGTKTAKCDRCDATDTIVDEGTKRGHSFSATYSYDNKGHWFASTCEHDLKTEYEEHTFGDPVVVDPTLETDGSKTFTCKCGYSYEEAISKDILIYTIQDPSEKTLRTPATCAEKATYYYVDEEGNTGSVYYEYGEPLPHDLVYHVTNGRISLTCNTCDFDTSKDYSYKKAGALNKENLLDVLLNSTFTISDVKGNNIYYYMPGLTYVERHSTSPGMEYFVYGRYDKLKSCGDNVFVSEKTNLDNNGSEFAKSNESYALIDGSKAATSYEYLNTLMIYNYMYDESSGYYSGTKGDSYIRFTVGEGKITSYYDSLGYSKTRKTIPSDALSLINEDLYPVESNNGVYTSGAKVHNSGCNHSFVYHFKDENNPETYVECEYCDFTTKGCSDLTNVDDDKLSRAQLASLILNSKLSFRQMLFGKPVDEHFFYKDNVVIRYAGGNDYQYWFYKNVNDDTVYYDKKFFNCSDLETLKKTPELASEKGFYFSNDVINNIDSRYPLNFACLEFVYNSSTQTYNYNWNGTVASIKVENGKITDASISTGSLDFKLVQDCDLTPSDSVFEELASMVYEIEDKSESEDKVYLWDEGKENILTTFNTRPTKVFNFINEKINEEIGVDFESGRRYFYDTNRNVYGSVSLLKGSAYVQYYGDDFEGEIYSDCATYLTSEFTQYTDVGSIETKTEYNFGQNGLLDSTKTVTDSTVYENGTKTETKSEYEYDDESRTYKETEYRVITYNENGRSLEEDYFVALEGSSELIKRSHTVHDYYADGLGMNEFKIEYYIMTGDISYSYNSILFTDETYTKIAELIWYEYNSETEEATPLIKFVYQYNELGEETSILQYMYNVETGQWGF